MAITGIQGYPYLRGHDPQEVTHHTSGDPTSGFHCATHTNDAASSKGLIRCREFTFDKGDSKGILNRMGLRNRTLKPCEAQSRLREKGPSGGP
jgi:hypothetical protein